MRYFRRGTSQIHYLPAWASDDPSETEINNGTRLDDEIAEITGFEFSNSPIATPDLASSFTTTIPGEDTVQNPSMTFYDTDATHTIRTALPKGTSGFVLFAPYGLADLLRCEKWPITTTSLNDLYTVQNEAAKFMVGFAVTGVPVQDASLPDFA